MNLVPCTLLYHIYTIVNLVYVMLIIIITEVVLQLFVFCSGLGYIAGAGITGATGDWRWALRVRVFPLSVNVNVSNAPLNTERQKSDYFFFVVR